jgi:predicted membrane channel-forming protein YqfA (hemolysin III family)
MVFVGAVIAGWDQIQTGAEFVWLLSDTLNAMMAMPNLIALAALSPIVFKLTQEFFTQEANRKRTRSNSVLTSVAMGCMALAVWPICMLDKSANLAITLTVCL